MPDRNPVGLVGVGLLGQALAHRLLGGGFEVLGFDVDPAKNARLAELGGRPASSLVDLAKRCDTIVLAVFSTDQVEQVVERELIPALGEPRARSYCAPAPATPTASPRWASGSPRAACAFWRRRSRGRAARLPAARASA